MCPFCDKSRWLLKIGSIAVLQDHHPVTPGHLLVVPQEHVEDISELSIEQWMDLWSGVGEALPLIGYYEGLNIGMNIGREAGQTVPHLHIHIIPRREGDTEDPAGGIRAVIPDKKTY